MNYEDLKVGMKVKLVTDFYPEDGGTHGIFNTNKKGDVLVVETFESGEVCIKNSPFYVTADMIEPVDADVFLNEALVPFKDLTDEQKLLIIREKMKGNVELYSDNTWQQTDFFFLGVDTIYRTKPVAEAPKETPLDLPWQFIKPEYKWAAMDEDKSVYVFEAEPHTESYYWNEVTGDFCCITDLLNIPIEGVVWNLSLTKREELD